MQERIIKFRDFDLHNKIMRYYHLDDICDNKIYNPNQYNTIMQFTGLYDKNGRDIYEGDILRYWIQYTEQADLYTVNDVYDLHIELNREYSHYRITSTEIVGNIYENLELVC
jgi:uncharacterized phage protein (TIGR01671 family)